MEAAPREASFVGESAPIRELLDLLGQVAMTSATVLVRGETGVGKELIARAIHLRSVRAHRAFVVVDCASLHDNLLQSELFGHERGAFTGAFAAKRGLFEAAHEGTLFLDEIAELSPALQVKLLRVLESGTFRRLGGMADVRVDVRIVAATNRRLEEMIHRGEFRQDLFYRLNVFPLEVPPLREHRDDIPMLVRHFLTLAGHRDLHVDAAALHHLVSHAWPGNVRELVHVLERAVILSNGGAIVAEHLPLAVRQRAQRPNELVERHAPAAPPAPSGPGSALHDLELEHILRVLREHRGHRKRAALALGISQRTLYRRLLEVRMAGEGDSSQQASGARPLPV